MKGYIEYIWTSLIDQKEFKILRNYSLTPIELKNPLVKGGPTDTDGDGLTDSQEVRWGNEYGSPEGNVKMTPEGYELPKLLDLWEDLIYIYGYDIEDVRFTKDMKETRILPLLSDPTLVDSDDDGLNDLEDDNPLINDFKELWYKFTINEKEFYIGRTGYGPKPVEAHIYDNDRGKWTHYSLLDGLWRLSEDACEIKRNIDEIKATIGFEEEEIVFEHPDQDVVIDLDDILGKCRLFLEGYDSFIEQIKADHRDEIDTLLGVFIGLIDCYFEMNPDTIQGKSTGKIKLDKDISLDKGSIDVKMGSPNLNEVKGIVILLLDEDEEELEESPVYMEAKVTTDKACTFAFSIIGGLSAIIGAAELAKGSGEVAAGVATAPESAGGSFVVAAKGGADLKSAVEKLDLARKYVKKSKNAYEEYKLDKEKCESGSKATGNIAKNLDTNNIPNMTKQEIIDAIPDNWKYTEHNGFVHIKDEVGKIRIRIDPPDKVTQYPHVHVYDNDGNLLDSLGNIVDRKSPDGHIPYKN